MREMKTVLFALAAFVLLSPTAVDAAGADVSDTQSEIRARLDKANASYAAGNLAEVESIAVEVRSTLEESAAPDSLLLAEACFRIMQSKFNRLMYSDSTAIEAGLTSLALLDASAQAPDTLRLEVHRLLGRSYTERRMSREALDHLNAALAIARRRTDWAGLPLSTVLFNLGNALGNIGENDSALAAYHESLAIRRKLEIPRDTAIGTCYAYMGTVYVQQDKPELAEEAFAASIRSLEEKVGPNHQSLNVPLSRAAAFEFGRGDYARSIDYNQRSLRILQTDPAHATNPNFLVVQLSIAQGLEMLGDDEQSNAVYKRVMPGIEAWVGPRHPTVLAGWLSVASSSSKLGDIEGALEIYARVRQTYEEDTAGTELAPLASVLVNEAMLLRDKGLADSALALAVRAEEITRRDEAVGPTMTLMSLSIQMSIHSRRGDWDEFDRIDATLQQDLERLAFAGNNETDVVWICRSEAAALRGRHADAVNAAANGARHVRERLVHNVRSLSDRQGLSLASTLSEPLDQLLRVGAQSDSASIRLCWDEVVRRRGIVRAEISMRRRPPGAAEDSPIAAAHAAWVSDQARLAKFDVGLGGSRDATSDSTLAALRARVDESERQLVRTIPASELPGDPSLVGIDSILARLPGDAALVGFVQAPGSDGERHLLAFLAGGESRAPRSLDLGDVESLEKLVGEWKAELGNSESGRRSEEICRSLGARVRSRVWDPIAAAVRSSRNVYVVLEAPVDGLPWGALPAATGGYLVESEPVVRVLEAEREIVPNDALATGAGLLALGAIDYEGARPESTAATIQIATLFRGLSSGCDSVAGRRLAALPATGAEVRDVEAAWSRGPASFGPSTRLEGEDATEAEFKRLAEGHQALHLATHGVMLSDACGDSAQNLRGVGGVGPIAADREASPSRPKTTTKTRRVSPWLGRQVFLALADANHARDGARDENEGLLTAEEVATLDLRGVDWVVLSACHSAAGEAWSGQGVLGMQRAFHLAGARTVIASQWSVEDQATREWMRALYEARSGGALRAADAMTEASRSALNARRQSGRSTHPFYWAAFTATGE